MVLAHQVGKERNFAVVVLLVIVTFGIYGIYWNYKAHNEVYKQFELAHDGRDEGIIWLILGYVLFQPLLWVYHYMFVNNVNYVRNRLSRPKGISSGGFLGLVIPGIIIYVIGMYMLLIGASLMTTEEGPGVSAGDAEDLQALGTVLAIAGIPAFLIGLTLQLIAYGRLQASLNDVWRAYSGRITELQGDPPEASNWQETPY